jgi:hypothetical protein
MLEKSEKVLFTGAYLEYFRSNIPWYGKISLE